MAPIMTHQHVRKNIFFSHHILSNFTTGVQNLRPKIFPNV